MLRPLLALIAAVARNRAIGKDNQLLWHEARDQRHFRATTTGHAVIMGRKTWQSLPERFRPLPERRNLVLTRDASWRAPGAEAVDSIASALALLEGTDRAFVIGGGEVYAAALPWADLLVLTEIDADLPGDTFFPPWDRTRFEEGPRERHIGADGVPYGFVTYRKVARA